MPITPGTLGGRGRMPGSLSSITPGTIGGGMGGGQFGGAAGTMGMGEPRRRLTGSGQITPGVLGGMGTVPGSLSSITPGTIGGGMGEPQGSGQITPGVLGGMGTVPGSLSSITPGTIGDPGWRQDLGNRFDAAVGSMSQPSPITPGVLGGGGVAPTFNPAGSGQFGGAIGGMDPRAAEQLQLAQEAEASRNQGQFGGAMGTMGPMEPPMPPPGFPGGISSPGFRGEMPPRPPGMNPEFAGQFSRGFPRPPGMNPEFAGQFGSRMGRPLPPGREFEGQYGARMGRPLPPGREFEGQYGARMGRPLPPRPPGFDPAMQGQFSRQRTMPRQGFGGQFSPQRTFDMPPGGFPGRYPAGHPMGGGMGLEGFQAAEDHARQAMQARREQMGMRGAMTRQEMGLQPQYVPWGR